MSDSETAAEPQSIAQRNEPQSADERFSVTALRNRPEAQVLIIGGGINGVGTFRDLALQGVDVALVERGDYCQGASGASSHMIHGGIRYLENGEFRLVKESVQERNRLLKLAPHYVKPLQTTIPIFSTFSGVLSAPLRFLTHKQQGKLKERGAFLIKLGLSIYDSFSRDGGSVPRHQFAAKERALQELPWLNPNLKYAATYFDASVHNPERLTLDVLRDGVEAGSENGKARASNYLEVTGIDDAGVQLTDRLTGKQFSFRAPVIINASGAWTDLTNGALGEQSSFMGGTKGSHIVLDHPELLAACGGRELFFEHTDGRIVLIYPMGDRVLVGTTDIDADIRNTESSICTDAEIDYFFDLIGHLFPDLPVTREHIVYSFAGVRPLPRHDDAQPGFVSRDYRIEQSTLPGAGEPVSMLSLIGGKWTTFRALSEHLADEALAKLGKKRKVSTAELTIGGGADFPETEEDVSAWLAALEDQARAAQIDEARARGLLNRYGSRAAQVIGYLGQGVDSLLQATHELSTRELEYMVEQEQVVHLIDVLIRRTSLAFRGLVSIELLEEIAQALSGPLSWDAQRAQEEVQHAREVLETFHRVCVPQLIS
ncbi:glycerol-3-phosphate dehydrogenase/oxidase [Acaricomes phytoseiuli]|uniref:glycerol-3-phosphate dehydrogenase/oxidase n=1 Tax=Acaricomes phytoseiuli TaxID=291968 RepID=UPI002223647D|nr:glycerol-3-phosphate dehydrogenase/oxidase [Acaricomes phytoseiuli]MCW1249157.1 glycerol-3-phosphate dehydrogenase/oxidase [Acaricomes phytoseiuli]